MNYELILYLLHRKQFNPGKVTLDSDDINKNGRRMMVSRTAMALDLIVVILYFN